ncbi:MAG: imidazolonepropionase [Spirochaetota bacterium]
MEGSKADGTLVVTGIGELATARGFTAKSGPSMRELARVKEAAIVVLRGEIAFAGPEADPGFAAAAEEAMASGAARVDARGAACVPGFVDSHTHFIFAGFREDEFFWRLSGMPYMEIHRKGGGIRRTMEATRAASAQDLREAGAERLSRMLSLGVTTVEGKSGYGLDFPTELRQLEAMRDLAASQPVRIVPTYMGAHSTPPEFEGRPGDYIDFLIKDCLPEVAAWGLARFADVFCEKGVFGIEDSRRYLLAARNLGLEPKLHADEVVSLGGAGLAAEVFAISADHLLKASPKDLDAMAEAGVVATCLPLTAFSLREPYADARGMIDRGLALALASDMNPGSCYSQSIPMIFALATVAMGLSFEETLVALTLNGAAALGMANRIGSVEAGKRGDFLLLDAPKPEHLAYHFGMNLVAQAFIGGVRAL